jgi:hypothetical protein
MTVKLIAQTPQWVNPALLETLLKTEGELRPMLDEQDDPWKKDQFDRWKNSEFNMKGASWHMIYYYHLGMLSMDDFKLPIDVQADRVEWWFCKIDPCCMFPMHVDVFKTEAKNFRRFCVPMQDYIAGHIFINDGKNLEDYSAGDVYEFMDPGSWHGAANISMIPKVSLQFVSYDL